ncbi:MAG TPA: ABC transporter permease [Thermoanaerobaculia bacterium]|nr:ABC transporter permease [Thermoanaerobaculia bacterium]
MKFLPYVFKSLFRKKTRSILTILSIVLPFFVICVLGTLLATLDADPSGGKGMFRLVVRHKVSLTNFIPEASRGRIAQLPGVEEVTILNWFGGTYKDNRPENMFARFGCEPEKLVKIFDEVRIVEGTAAEWASDRSGALVGERLMKRYGWKIGDKFVLKGDIFPTNLELTVRAVFRGSDETGVYFDRKAIEEAVPWAKGQVGTFWIKAASADAVQSLPRQIDALFENSSFPTKTETEKEFQNGFVSMLGNVKAVVTGISTAIALVILLISANTMAMAARERVTEIAVLRTLGFGKPLILTLILGESLLLSATGAFVGLGLFRLSFPALKEGLLSSPMAGFAAGMQLFPEVLATGIAVTLLVGLGAGIVPAIRSARRSIPDGLRQVG